MTGGPVDKWIEKYRMPVTITVVLTLQSFGIIVYISQWAERHDSQMQQVMALVSVVNEDGNRISRMESGEQEENITLDRINAMLVNLIQMHMESRSTK